MSHKKSISATDPLYTSTLPKKTFSKLRVPFTKLPNLVENQITSFKKLLEVELPLICKEFNPIQDYSGRKFSLEFTSFILSTPKFDEIYAKANKVTYDASLRATVKLKNKSLGTDKEQEIFMADFPIMTPHGTFIINGVERSVVPQLARSAGEFFDSEEINGKKYFSAKIVPSRGVWLEIISEDEENMYVKIDKKRKFSVISLLRAIGFGTDA